MATDNDKEVISQAIREGLSYPLEVADGSTGSGYGGQTTDVRRLIHRTLGEVLGWNARREDPKGFKAALNNVFTPIYKAGATYYKWTPRTYSVQADLGEITGTQAAIYTRARRTLDYVLPLLDGLKPLVETADIEDCNGVRNLVRAEITELVEQLGAIGGPVVPRVDALFEVLFGNEHWDEEGLNFLDDGVASPSKRQNPGQLDTLRQVFRLEEEFVNVLGEEQSLTNFQILFSDLDVLRVNWINQRNFFTRIGNQKAYLGTRLVLLSRDLEVIAESVQEARDAFNRVKISDAERSTVPIYIFKRAQNGSIEYEVTSWLTVAEMLDWIETFATDHGVQILQEGGKYGVGKAFVPMLDEMIDVLEDALHQDEFQKEPDPHYPPQSNAFFELRVMRALENLLSGVRRARSNAEPIEYKPPQQATISQVKEAQNQINNLSKQLRRLNGEILIIQQGGGIGDPGTLEDAHFVSGTKEDNITIAGSKNWSGEREAYIFTPEGDKIATINHNAIKKISGENIQLSLKKGILTHGNYEIRVTYFSNGKPHVGISKLTIS